MTAFWSGTVYRLAAGSTTPETFLSGLGYTDPYNPTPPRGLDIDSNGNLFIALFGYFAPTGSIVKVPKGSTSPQTVVLGFTLGSPVDVGVDSEGNLYFMGYDGTPAGVWKLPSGSSTPVLIVADDKVGGHLDVDDYDNLFYLTGFDDGMISVMMLAKGSTTPVTVASGLSQADRPMDLSVKGGYVYITFYNGGYVARVPVVPKVEIEISSFDVRSSSQIYFTFKIENTGETFRSPKEGYETYARPGQTYLGPIFIPESRSSFPLSFTIKAFRKTIFGDLELTSFGTTLTYDQLPYSFDHVSTYINFKVSVRLINPQLLTMPITPTTNDPQILKQWGWFQTGVDKVLEEHSTSVFEPVIVAVLDSGVYWEHPDLKNKIWQNSGEIGIDSKGRDKSTNGIDDDNNGYIDDWNGFDFIHSSYSVITKKWSQYRWEFPSGTGTFWYGPMDDSNNAHGTKVAGVIGAEINNEEGIAGLLPNARIMIVKVTDKNNVDKKYPDPSHFILSDSVIEGIKYAVKNGAKVICMSLGSYSVWPSILTLQSVINDAYSKGIVIVAASGNEQTSNPSYPAALSKVISVSALSRLDVNTHTEVGSYLYLHKTSNYGPSLTDPTQSVEVSAPGYNILSTSYLIESRN
ncbi:MAG: S8 family serine peptidase, partial [Nitrososphaerales archaeon]